MYGEWISGWLNASDNTQVCVPRTRHTHGMCSLIRRYSFTTWAFAYNHSLPSYLPTPISSAFVYQRKQNKKINHLPIVENKHARTTAICEWEVRLPVTVGGNFLCGIFHAGQIGFYVHMHFMRRRHTCCLLCVWSCYTVSLKTSNIDGCFPVSLRSLVNGCFWYWFVWLMDVCHKTTTQCWSLPTNAGSPVSLSLDISYTKLEFTAEWKVNHFWLLTSHVFSFSFLPLQQLPAEVSKNQEFSDEIRSGKEHCFIQIFLFSSSWFLQIVKFFESCRDGSALWRQKAVLELCGTRNKPFWIARVWLHHNSRQETPCRSRPHNRHQFRTPACHQQNRIPIRPNRSFTKLWRLTWVTDQKLF